MATKTDTPHFGKTLSVGGNEEVKVLEDGSIVERTPTGERHFSASVAIDSAAEKRLVWKFDSRILPTLAVMYLLYA